MSLSDGVSVPPVSILSFYSDTIGPAIQNSITVYTFNSFRSVHWSKVIYIYCFLGHRSPQPKRHLDRFSRFAGSNDQQTHTDRAAYVAMGTILCYVLRRGLIMGVSPSVAISCCLLNRDWLWCSLGVIGLVTSGLVNITSAHLVTCPVRGKVCIQWRN